MTPIARSKGITSTDPYVQGFICSFRTSFLHNHTEIEVLVYPLFMYSQMAIVKDEFIPHNFCIEERRGDC